MNKQYYDSDLKIVIERRNRRLKEFFKRGGYNVKILGDMNKPVVVLDNKILISCYVKNFNLYFNKEPFSSTIVESIKLTGDAKLSKERLKEIFTTCKHRTAFKLKFGSTSLYLSGYNYVDKQNKTKKYPVFARFDPKIYFTESKAKEVAEFLENEGYTIEIEK